MEHAPRSPSLPPTTSGHRTHHMLCLQVLPQLFAEVISTEFHNHSPAGPQPSVQRASPRIPPPRFPPSLQPLPPYRSLPPFLGRPRRQHFRLLAPLNSQQLANPSRAGEQLVVRSRLHTLLLPAGGAASRSAGFPGICRTILPCFFLNQGFAVLATQPFPRCQVTVTPPTLDLQPRKCGWTMQQDPGASSVSTCSTARTLGIGAAFTLDSLSIPLVGSGNTTRVARKVEHGGPAGEDPGKKTPVSGRKALRRRRAARAKE